MALGIDPAQQEQMLAELRAMNPAELESLIESLQDDTDDLSDGHLVNFLDEFKRESYDASKKKRTRWTRLWDAHENEMAELADKEDWQSQIVLNKPFTTSVHAKSLVRRGLLDRPDALNLDPKVLQDPAKRLKASFWDKSLKYWTKTRDAYLPDIVADAAEMGFAVGTSAGVKGRWRADEKGIYRLELVNIPPWNIYDDPDRKPRKNWSGLGIVHEEWIDYYQLLEDAMQGFYDEEQVRLVVTGGRQDKNAMGYTQEDKDEERRRKGQLLVRNRYRKSVLVSEYWGSLLDENGDLLAHNCRFVVANGIVIRRPNLQRFPFRRLRWPIVQFSPLPHVLGFHGYGLYEGVMAMWAFQNNLLNLYIDNENWRINNMFEVDPSLLEDPNDLEFYPLKAWIRKRNMDPSHPAVRAILKGDSNLQDVQFMWELATRSWEDGSFVTEPLKGVQPERERTLGELQMKQQASMGVFDSMGRDCERGVEDVGFMCKEILTTFWDETDQPSLADVLGSQSPELAMMQQAGLLMPQERIKALDLDADIQVSGISRLIDRSDLIEKLNMLVALGDNPRFTPFMKDYDIAKRLFEEFNQDDLIKTPEEVQMDMMGAELQQRNAMIAGAIDQALVAADAGRQGEVEHGRTMERESAKRQQPAAAGAR